MKGFWSRPVCTLKGQTCILRIASSAEKVLLWATKYAGIWVRVKMVIMSFRGDTTIKSKLTEARFGQV